MPFRSCLFLLLALWACQPDPRPAPGQLPQRQDILRINERPQQESPYEVQWGGVRVPLVKYANPEVYSGSIEVDLSKFRAIVGQELKLLKNRRELEAEVVSIHREPHSRFSSFWFSYPGFESSRLEASVISALRQGIQQGDVLAIRLFSKTDSAIVQSVNIKVADPFEPYVPAVQVPRPQYGGDVFGFQVIQESGRRPLLRIDTARQATRHIYQLYRYNRLYKVIHIPGFQSRRRLLTDKDRLFRTREVRHSELLGCGQDWLSLPEYTAFAGADVNLWWGDMLASPASENYHLHDFRANITQGLRLMVGRQELPIRGFHLFVASRDGLPELYVADSLETPALLRALFKVQPASTVYFDKLAVESADGQLMAFPVAFAFNIGFERPYTLTLGPASSVAAPPAYQANGQDDATVIRFQNYPLSGMIPLLLGLDSSQVRFRDWGQDTRLDALFTSAHYPVEDGKALLLRELQSRHGFELEWANVLEAWELSVGDSADLHEFKTTEDRDFIQYKDDANKTALLVYVTPSRLARFLTEELNVSVVNQTGLPADTKLRIEMDFASLASARESLRRHGLALERLKKGAAVVARRFR